MKQFIITISLTVLYVAATAQVKDRDGNTYTIKIMADNKYWMTENLNTNLPGSLCYEDSAKNCQLYGRLYTWKSAQEACLILGDGWHLPTDEEWQQMAKHYGGIHIDSAHTGKEAYKALLHGGSSGFNALLGGGCSPGSEGYKRLNAHGFYWTATEQNSQIAWMYNFAKGSKNLYRQDGAEKVEALSVRCIKGTK